MGVGVIGRAYNPGRSLINGLSVYLFLKLLNTERMLYILSVIN